MIVTNYRQTSVIKKTFIVLLVIPSATVLAADWQYITGGKDFTVNIDLQSIAPAGNGRMKAWTKYIYSEARSLPGYGTYQSALTLDYYDCTQKSTATIQQVFYADTEGNKNIFYQSVPAKDARYEDVVPGSINETELLFVCSKQVKTKR